MTLKKGRQVAIVGVFAAFDTFAMALEAEKSLGLAVANEHAYYEKVSEGLARAVTTLGDLVTLIFACGAVLGAAITMNEAIARRRREIGVLRARLLGARGDDRVLARIGGDRRSGSAARHRRRIAARARRVPGHQLRNGQRDRVSPPSHGPTSCCDLLRSLAAGALVGVLGGSFPR